LRQRLLSASGLPISHHHAEHITSEHHHHYRAPVTLLLNNLFTYFKRLSQRSFASAVALCQWVTHKSSPLQRTSHQSTITYIRAPITTFRAHITPNLELFVTYLHTYIILIQSNPRTQKQRSITYTGLSLKQIQLKPPNHTKKHTTDPPPQCTHADSRPKTKKTVNLNSPNSILFVIQRKISEFLHYKKRHLVTLFSVCLRVFPFSKNSPKTQFTQNFSNLGQSTTIQLFFVVPLLRDDTLILF
jgi:hypothetical protein